MENMKTHKRKRQTAAFTLVEILITMAIMTILFVATGTAFDAAFKNYDANTKINSINTTHRNINHQFTSSIRSAWNDPDIAAISVSSSGNTLSFTDSGGRFIEYIYDVDQEKLTIQIDGGTPATLLENITPIDAATDIFSLSYPPASDGFSAGTVSKVTINFKTTYQNMSKNISVAAVPRNIVFGR